MRRRINSKAPCKGIRGRIIHTLGPEEVVDIADGVLVLDAEGRIITCEPYEFFVQRGVDLPLEHFKYRLIIPGLVDCHLHMPQLDQRGKFGVTLMDWLNDYILPAEASFADPKVADDVGRRFFKKLILNGTTTAAIYSTIHEGATDHAFELARIAGIRAIMGKVMMDANAPAELSETIGESLDVSQRLYDKWHGKEGGRLRYAFAPRFAPTCSLTMWRELGRMLETSEAYVQSHIAETERENALVREVFPNLPDYFSLFEETGTAGPRTLLGHAIYLSDDEYRRMAASRTRIIHCPTSNFFLKSGSMPMSRVDAAGVTFGLGTDVGAGTSMSLFAEMRHADFSQRDMNVSPVRALYLATLGGARALSMDTEIGNFEEGKYADFCVIDIKKIDYYYKIKELDTLSILSLIMYRGDSHTVEAAYVAGNRLDVDALNT